MRISFFQDPGAARKDRDTHPRAARAFEALQNILVTSSTIQTRIGGQSSGRKKIFSWRNILKLSNISYTKVSMKQGSRSANDRVISK